MIFSAVTGSATLDDVEETSLPRLERYSCPRKNYTPEPERPRGQGLLWRTISEPIDPSREHIVWQPNCNQTIGRLRNAKALM
jgi:hypothetical protein